MNPDCTPKTKTSLVWLTLQVKIARGKKWA